MKSSINAILFSALIGTAATPPPADACGVKLTIKGSAHRKGVARTSNPSDVLLLGSPPRRLSRDLAAAGHRVEVAPSPAAAKRKSYAVVIADNEQAGSAREKFPNAVVLVRSGDTVADMRTVEKQVARKPVKTPEDRDVVAAREERTPIAAGPIQPKREIVGAAEPKEPEATKPPEVAKAVEQPKPVTAKTVETKPAEPVAEADPAPSKKPAVAPKTVSRSGSEVYFAVGVAESNDGALKNVVKWLTDSPDVEVIIEGHADPTGNAQKNVELSQRRAEWVRDVLVAGGIDSSRIEVKAFGAANMKYDARSRKNRRAAIVAK